MEFRYLERGQFERYARGMFSILAENMSRIAPTGNSFEADYCNWRESMANALRDPDRHVVMFLAAVSYTHLEVYKRQVHGYGHAAQLVQTPNRAVDGAVGEVKPVQHGAGEVAAGEITAGHSGLLTLAAGQCAAGIAAALETAAFQGTARQVEVLGAAIQKLDAI